MIAALHRVHLTLNHIRDFVATAAAAADGMTNVSSLVS